MNADPELLPYPPPPPREDVFTDSIFEEYEREVEEVDEEDDIFLPFADASRVDFDIEQTVLRGVIEDLMSDEKVRMAIIRMVMCEILVERGVSREHSICKEDKIDQLRKLGRPTLTPTTTTTTTPATTTTEAMTTTSSPPPVLWRQPVTSGYNEFAAVPPYYYLPDGSTLGGRLPRYLQYPYNPFSWNYGSYHLPPPPPNYGAYPAWNAQHPPPVPAAPAAAAATRRAWASKRMDEDSQGRREVPLAVERDYFPMDSPIHATLSMPVSLFPLSDGKHEAMH